MTRTPHTLALGIDVGGTAIKSVLATAQGEIHWRDTRPTPDTRRGGVEPLIEVIAQITQEARAAHAQEAALADYQMADVVGVDVPGIVDDAAGMAVLSVNMGWENYPMTSTLAERLGCAVSFSHDVRSGAWAESRWGAGSANSFYLALGTGIASVTILDGAPVVNGGWAGEVGQMLVPDPDQPGASERLEAVCSAGGVARRYARACTGLNEEEAYAQSTTEAGAAWAEIVERGALGVEQAVKAGDDRARHVWDTAVDTLADLIAGTVCCLGPLDVVIGGGLMNAGDFLFDPLREKVASRLSIAPVPTISPATLGSWSQALGSAGRALGC